MDELTKQNFRAMSEGLKEQRSKTSELQITINSYNQQIGHLQQQIQKLQQDLGLMRAIYCGTGATT